MSNKNVFGCVATSNKNVFASFAVLFFLLPAFCSAFTCDDINPKTGMSILTYIGESHKITAGRDVVTVDKRIKYCKDIEEKDYRFLLLINQQYETIGLLNCTIIKNGVRKECDKKLIETYLDGIILYLPEMKKGDSMEFSYQNDIKFPLDKVWSTSDIYLESESPIEKKDLTIEVPKALDFQYYASKQEPEISETAVNRLYSWHVENVPYYEEESLMPPLRHSLSRVSFTTFKSWDEVEEWFEGLFTEVMKKQYVEVKAAEVARGASTDREKVESLYNWVRDNITYQQYGLTFLSGYKPRELDDILRDQAGDCKGQAALLVTMLESVGIKSNPVIISYRDITRDVPGPYSFYHAVVHVPDVDGGMWLDTTCYYCPAGYLPSDYQNMYSLTLLDREKGFKPTMSLPAEKIAMSISSEDDVLSKDGSATIDTAVRMYDETAYAYQYQIRKKGLDSIQAILKEGMDELVTAECGEGKVSNFTMSFGDLNTNFSFSSTCKRYATKSGDKLILSAGSDSSGGLSAFSDIISKDKRRFPILIPYEIIFYINGSIKLPSCYAVEELPPSKSVDESFISVEDSLSYMKESNTLYTSALIKFKPDEIAAENFSNFKEVVSKLTEPYSIIAAPQDAAISSAVKDIQDAISKSGAASDVKATWGATLSSAQALSGEGKCGLALTQLKALQEEIKGYGAAVVKPSEPAQTTLEQKDGVTTQPTTTAAPAAGEEETPKDSGQSQGCLPALPAVLAVAVSLLMGVPYILIKR
ncbi:MAG: transglutaminase-like domain-containing protein [Candidatus Altiarchaeota archaeon]|nr:transglutaminase-like domain-containing protein [Candidatus Altiarchaeota archaeon]